MFSWNLENWKGSANKTKSSTSIKLRYFHFSSNSLFYWPLQLDKSCFQKIDLYKHNLVPRRTRLIDINYIKLCNTLLQIWCSIFRERLHETRSELKPVWNLKSFWNVAPFTWQFTSRYHCDNFPNNSKTHYTCENDIS